MLQCISQHIHKGLQLSLVGRASSDTVSDIQTFGVAEGQLQEVVWIKQALAMFLWLQVSCAAVHTQVTAQKPAASWLYRFCVHQGRLFGQ